MTWDTESGRFHPDRLSPSVRRHSENPSRDTRRRNPYGERANPSSLYPRRTSFRRRRRVSEPKRTVSSCERRRDRPARSRVGLPARRPDPAGKHVAEIKTTTRNARGHVPSDDLIPRCGFNWFLPKSTFVLLFLLSFRGRTRQRTPVRRYSFVWNKRTVIVTDVDSRCGRIFVSVRGETPAFVFRSEKLRCEPYLIVFTR